MRTELVHFVWERPARTGQRQHPLWLYRWIKAVTPPTFQETGSSFFLTGGFSYYEQPPSEQYRPLRDITALFAQFAALDISPVTGLDTPALYDHPDLPDEPALLPKPTVPQDSPILAFATQYGMLTEGVIITEPGQQDYLRGEAREFWIHEIEAMRRAVQLRDLLQPAPNLLQLKKVIRWKTDQAIFYDPTGTWTGPVNTWVPIKPVTSNPRALGAPQPVWLKPGDVLQAAWFCLRAMINSYLSRYVPTQVEWQRYALGETDTEGERSENGLLLSVVPKNLLGGLWLQLAMVVGDNREIRTCTYCKTPLVIAPDQARRNMLYCRDSCRVRDCNKRKRERVQKQLRHKTTRKTAA